MTRYACTLRAVQQILAAAPLLRPGPLWPTACQSQHRLLLAVGFNPMVQRFFRQIKTGPERPPLGTLALLARNPTLCLALVPPVAAGGETGAGRSPAGDRRRQPTAASLSPLSSFFSLLLSLQATQDRRRRGTVEEPAPLWPTRGGSVLLEEDGASPMAAEAHRGSGGNALCPRRGPFPFGRGGGELLTALVLLPTPWHTDARWIERNGASMDDGTASPEVR
jgi:hypothetical protein